MLTLLLLFACSSDRSREAQVDVTPSGPVRREVHFDGRIRTGRVFVGGQLLGAVEPPNDQSSRKAQSKAAGRLEASADLAKSAIEIRVDTPCGEVVLPARCTSLCTKMGAELTLDTPEAGWPVATPVWVDSGGAPATLGALALTGQPGEWISGLTCAPELTLKVGERSAPVHPSEDMKRGVFLTPQPDACYRLRVLTYAMDNGGTSARTLSGAGAYAIPNDIEYFMKEAPEIIHSQSGVDTVNHELTKATCAEAGAR